MPALAVAGDKAEAEFGRMGRNATPEAERHTAITHGEARGPWQAGPFDEASVLAANAEDTETGSVPGLAQQEIEAEIAAREAQRELLLDLQASSVGMDPAKWRKLVGNTDPALLAELIAELGQRENEGLRSGRIADDDPRPVFDGIQMTRSGRVDEADIRALADRLLPAKMRLKYTLLVDPPGPDGKRRSISIVQKSQAAYKVMHQNFTTNLFEVEFVRNTIPCGYTDSRGAPCPYRTNTLRLAIDHRRYHHPEIWAAQQEERELQRQEQERAAIERQEKLLAAILTRIGPAPAPANGGGDTSMDAAMAARLSAEIARLADQLTRRDATAGSGAGGAGARAGT